MSGANIVMSRTPLKKRCARSISLSRSFSPPPLSLSLSSLARSLSGRVCARAQERVSRKRDSVVVGQSPTCGGDGTSDNKTLPEYPRAPHAMQGAACCMRVWCLDAAGRACGAGPAAAEKTAGLAGMRCGMRKRLRLMRCVLRTVRNDAHPRTFRTLADLDYRDTQRLN